MPSKKGGGSKGGSRSTKTGRYVKRNGHTGTGSGVGSRRTGGGKKGGAKKK